MQIHKVIHLIHFDVIDFAYLFEIFSCEQPNDIDAINIISLKFFINRVLVFLFHFQFLPIMQF